MSMFEQHTMFFQRSKKIAENFLQTTIIVDDQVVFGAQSNQLHPPVPVEDIEEPGRKGKPMLSQEPVAESVNIGTETQEIGSHVIDAQKIINSFADKRIVCSVIKPESNNDWMVSVQKLASTVDIIILDWEINKDNGQDTKQLLGNILQSANEEPGQLRLIVIYTGDNGIVGISEQINTELQKKLAISSDQITEEEGGFVLVFGSMRVVILSKPGTRNLPEEYKSRIVEFEKLADRVTSEFALMTTGLVSNTVLHSLSQIRLNTYKLLNTFSRTLNAPYLTHRALLPNPEDAETLLNTLVAKEIQGIIEESNVGHQGGLDAIKEWLASQDPPVVIDFDLNNQKVLFDTSEKIGTLLERGIHSTLKDRGGLTGEVSNNQLKEVLKELEKNAHNLPWTKSFGRNDQIDDFSDDKFANITIMRSYYERSVPKMTLGTILKNNDDNTYWLCLQPRCDCVRIETNRAFPFLFLKSSNQKFSLVVFDNNGYIRLLPSYKPYALRLFTFSTKPEYHGEIVADIEASSYFFVDDNNQQYKWLGELKSEHAQRIANEFAANLSRVGLDESEWLRLWATKG
jgi:hypothetical protein